ncbi:hypothetical protein TNCV_2268051 [Trichonephila clavipes]|nr:hypothetical protein TNCV_2268051 [Trichonephila clavipes]
MISVWSRRVALLSIRVGDPFQAKVRLLFPKIQPCLIRDSNPSPLDYKASVITALLGEASALPCNVNTTGRSLHARGKILRNHVSEK